MSGSVEVKKILKTFSKHWCQSSNKGSLKIKDHVEFLKDTDELFEMVLQRILDETEHLSRWSAVSETPRSLNNLFVCPATRTAAKYCTG